MSIISPAAPPTVETSPRSTQKDSSLRVPDDAMAGLGRAFADLYSTYFESPRAFWYFAFLTHFGARVDKLITLDSALEVSPRIYTVILGQSADDRKSTAQNETTKFFESLDEAGPSVLFGIGSAEGLAAELEESDNKKVLLIFDEFKAFVDKATIQNSVLIPMVSTLFENRDYDTRTKKKSLRIRGVSLTLLAACTVETYSSMFSRTFRDIGFLNRLWLVVGSPHRRIALPESIPHEKREALQARVCERLTFIYDAWKANGHKPLKYRLTSEAQARFEAWYNTYERSIFTKRLDTYGHRLMLLLAATADVHTFDIGLDIVEQVINLLSYQLDARRECDPVDAENVIAALEEKIRRALRRGPFNSYGKHTLKKRDLKKKVHAERFGLWAWESATRNLREAGEVTIKGDEYTLDSEEE